MPELCDAVVLVDATELGDARQLRDAAKMPDAVVLFELLREVLESGRGSG